MINPRAALAFAHDVAAAGVAWSLAFWVRFNLDVPEGYVHVLLERLPWVAAIHAGVFWIFGLYRGLWRYASLPDLQRILMAVGTAALAVPAALALVRIGEPVPRSVYLVAPVILVIIMGGSRLAYRAWKEGRLGGVVARPKATPVVVLGAGQAGANLVKDLAVSQDWRVVALLDDDEQKFGREIHGVKIRGALKDVGAVAGRFGVGQAIISMPGASHTVRRRAAELCDAAGIKAMTVPAYADIVSGRVSVSALRNVELDDLLGRDPVRLDDPGLQAFLSGRTVLVTGAGGSIGAELCRQIARFHPDRLVLFDLSEYALYTIEQEFRDRTNGLPVDAVIGDVRDPQCLQEVFGRFRPQVVFHAAAYKHVPLMEGRNALQAARNNIGGTLAVARACQATGIEKMILVSTDKAVNPTNVMGATKRVAELCCQALQPAGRTQFVIVRFGNVLGSTGSVVPRFREQISRGGPVTVTHPEITRFFMSIPEAAQLVLQAACMGEGGQIYVLDMGDPVRIADLARQLIRLSGFTEDEIRIEFTGLRAGEKLYEELLADTETTLATPNPRLRIARARAGDAQAPIAEIEAWLATPGDVSPEAVRARLKDWVPDYAPGTQGKAA